jgi:hypothetical protein
VHFISELRRRVDPHPGHSLWSATTVEAPGIFRSGVFSLTLGVAASVTVFSVLHRVLLHPFPYRYAERIIEFNFRDKLDIEETPHMYREQIGQLRASRSIEDVVEMDEQNLADTTFEIPLDTDVVFLSGNAFPFFGVPAMLGRTFLPSDDPPERAPEPVAVLSYQYWKRRQMRSTRSLPTRQLALCSNTVICHATLRRPGEVKFVSNGGRLAGK